MLRKRFCCLFGGLVDRSVGWLVVRSVGRSFYDISNINKP